MSKTSFKILAVVGTMVLSGPVLAQMSATGGTGGSAAAGGTSASTLGTGSTSTGSAGTGSSLATGGSAAAVDGKVQSRSKVNETGSGDLKGQAKAQAHDGGTFSKSHTKTRVDAGEGVSSTTKSMSHVPGEKPVKSTTSTNTGATR